MMAWLSDCRAKLVARTSAKSALALATIGAVLVTYRTFYHLLPPDHSFYLPRPKCQTPTPLPHVPATADPRLYALGLGLGLGSGSGSNQSVAWTDFNVSPALTESESLRFDEGLPVNRREYRRATTIFYNKVPKCSSTTTYTIMQRLGVRNHFKCKLMPTLHTSFSYEFKGDEEQAFTSAFQEAKQRRVLFHGHFYFKDISSYATAQNRSRPFYINLVREPLDRMQSFYYFIRYQKGHIREMSPERQSMSFSECVRRLDPECTHSDNYMTQLSFFCGPMPFCRLPRMGALEQAKRNVLKYYTLVGTMARLRDFFVALEWTFPTYFRGAALTYDYAQRKNVSVHNKLSDIPYSRHLEPDVKYIMTSLLHEDYDFYRFIQQRFAAYMKYIQDDELDT